MHPSRAAALASLSAGVAAVLGAPPVRAAATGGTAVAPGDALARLLSGNERYRTDRAINCNRNYHRRAEVAAAQAPFAIVLGCADSRVPPEVVFDRGLGDLFVVRVAGNIASDDAIGSIEYALEHFHCGLVMVLGHERCGAVSAAVDAAKSGTMPGGFVGGIVAAIEPAVRRSRDERGDALHAAVRANARDVAARLRSASAVVRTAETAGSCRVVAATYDLTTGSVALQT